MTPDREATGRRSKPEAARPSTPVEGRASYGVGVGEEARALFLQGRALEDADDVEGALSLYRRALATPEGRLRPFDIGTLLLRVGKCASILGDGPQAWDAYLGAALVIPGHDATALVETLAEAGLLRVTLPSTLPMEASVDEALVRIAFDGAIEGARRCLISEESPTYAAAMRSHRAFTGLMVLAAHAGLDAELSRASRSLFRDVAAPFARRHDVRRKDPAHGSFLLAVTVEALARLCDAVAKMEEGRRSDVPPTRSEVGSLLHHAGEAFVGDSLATMSRWLGMYLGERCDIDWATDDFVVGAVGHGTAVGRPASDQPASDPTISGQTLRGREFPSGERWVEPDPMHDQGRSATEEISMSHAYDLKGRRQRL